MFSKKITESDAFLDMPIGSQNLYFHLSMYADDDGFIDKPKSIMRMLGTRDDDLKVLITKKFIIPFDSGVIVIKHWRMNNYLRNDRYKKTQYLEEKSQLTIKENGSYKYVGIPKANQMDTKYSIEEKRIEENSIDKNNNNATKVADVCLEVQKIFDYWNKLEIIKHRKLNADIKKAIEKAIKKYSFKEVYWAISHYSEVLNSEYFFKYEWSLADFLNRKNGISTFMDDGSNWNGYLKWKEEQKVKLPTHMQCDASIYK